MDWARQYNTGNASYGECQFGTIQYEKVVMKDIKHNDVTTKLGGSHCNTVPNVAVALVIAASVMACADMSTKPSGEKAIDAAVPLTSSASALAQDDTAPDEAAEADAIKYRGNDQ